MVKQKINRFSLLGSVIFGISILVGCGSNDASLGSNMQQEFLPVEQAFVFSANAESYQLLKTRWKIAEGYHLYKNQFKFSVSPSNYTIVAVDYPKADMFTDKILGNLESYKGEIEVSIRLTGEPSNKLLSLTSRYQGCADVGLCYPPETKVTEFDLAAF